MILWKSENRRQKIRLQNGSYKLSLTQNAPQTLTQLLLTSHCTIPACLTTLPTRLSNLPCSLNTHYKEGNYKLGMLLWSFWRGRKWGREKYGGPEAESVELPLHHHFETLSFSIMSSMFSGGLNVICSSTDILMTFADSLLNVIPLKKLVSTSVFSLHLGCHIIIIISWSKQSENFLWGSSKRHFTTCKQKSCLIPHRKCLKSCRWTQQQ